MSSSSIVVVVLLLLVVIVVSVSASGVFELRMDRFQNELGRDAKGHCCRGFKTSSGSGLVGAANGRCSETCRTQFRVCLKQYQTSIDLSGPCIFGDYLTPVIGDNSLDLINNNNNISSSSSSSSDNTTGYTVRLPFDFSWPVSLLFLLVVSSLNSNYRHFLFFFCFPNL